LSLAKIMPGALPCAGAERNHVRARPAPQRWRWLVGHKHAAAASRGKFFAVTAEMGNACSAAEPGAVGSRKIVATWARILSEACRKIHRRERNLPISGPGTLAGSPVFWHGPQPE
jgi:hypothetical protein